MTDCPNGDVRDALPDYLNDRLDPVRRREAESHLAGCAACREELSLLRALRATMQRAPAVDVGAIAAAIPAYRAPVQRSRATTWRVAAAIVALAAGGTSIALLRARTSAQREDASPNMIAVQTPRRDPAHAVVPPPTREAEATRRPTPVGESNRPVATRELAMASGSIGELSDAELSVLVEGIESLDAVPTTEVEGAAPVSIGAQEGL